MAIRVSTKFRNKISEGYGVRELLRDGRIYIYSGSQPANADTAPTGTLLATFTLSGGTFTPPVGSAASLTISGSTGTLDTVTVGGMAFDLLGGTPVAITSGSLGTSADNIAAQINATQNPLNIEATSDSVDTITLTCPAWMGANADGLTVAHTETTSTVTVNGGSSATFGGTGSPNGGTTAVNGLNFQFPASSGVLSKESTVWQDTSADNTGTAGWFRFVAGGSLVSGGTTEVVFDGNVATSGGDLNMTSTSITASSTQTISTFTITFPSS